MIKFLFSRHRSTYIKMGVKYKVWPEYVYRLAHGKKHGRHSTDSKILHELLAIGIIHRHSNHYSNEDDKVDFHNDGK